MTSEWHQLSPVTQQTLARTALARARVLVAAQATLLAQRIECGTLPGFDGPDALRLLVLALGDDPPQPGCN